MEKQKRKKTIRIILIAAATAVVAAAAVLLAWSHGAFLPKWIGWQEKEISLAGWASEEDPANYVIKYGGVATSENEGDEQTDILPERIELSKKKVRVFLDGEVVWESPEHFLVQDVLWDDIDHDGEGELMLLGWKIGRYGRVLPFWEKEERTWSQHIFLYDWRKKEIRALWLASDIGMEAQSWEFTPKGRLMIKEPSGRTTRWDWLSWGLEYIEEIIP